MRYGIKGHGMMIAVENLPRQKNPSLTVYVDGDAEAYKVATFRGEAEAEWFVEMAAELLGVKVVRQDAI